jgi:hypothetical protein
MGKVVLPTGAILIVVGVYLNALLERLGLGNTQDGEYKTLSAILPLLLLVGTLLVIVGSFLDGRRLPAAQTRVRGILCWVAGGISFLLLVTIGNVHGWTAIFIVPAFAGFVAGVVLLSKPNTAK